MDMQRAMTLAPFVACLVCAVSTFFAVRSSCTSTVGRIPGVGKLCTWRWARYGSMLSAVLCGSLVLGLVRNVLGPQ